MVFRQASETFLSQEVEVKGGRFITLEAAASEHDNVSAPNVSSEPQIQGQRTCALCWHMIVSSSSTSNHVPEPGGPVAWTCTAQADLAQSRAGRAWQQSMMTGRQLECVARR